jgi:hypothetical protein
MAFTPQVVGLNPAGPSAGLEHLSDYMSDNWRRSRWIQTDAPRACPHVDLQARTAHVLTFHGSSFF